MALKYSTGNPLILVMVFYLVTGVSLAPASSLSDWQDPEFKSISIEVPPYAGKSYKAEIPDTIELADRAALCINSITSLVNPEFDFAQYTYVDLRHDPPYMAMEAGITNLNHKCLEALPMLRIM